MASITWQFALPNEQFRLEEINLPEKSAAALAGQAVSVEVLLEVPSRTLRIDLDGPPAVCVSVIVDDDGPAWNDDWPARVRYTDLEGREWRLPRHWLSDGVSPVITASRYHVTREACWMEAWAPPTLWDLGDINIQDVPGPDGEVGVPEIEVRVSPGEIPKVFWRGPSGRVWRIPHDWRRRRIKLPDRDGLLRNNFPLYVAEEFGGRIVAVNFHLGSLCCLPDGYRVRNGASQVAASVSLSPTKCLPVLTPSAPRRLSSIVASCLLKTECPIPSPPSAGRASANSTGHLMC